MKTRHRHQCRSGNVLVLTALLMVFMFGILAFAVDLGYINVIRTQLQSSADAAALASAWDLMDENADPFSTARDYAGRNLVAGERPALASEDIQIGYLANPSDPNAQMVLTAPSCGFNAVRIRTRRTADQNGLVPLFFARVMGITSSSAEAEATAAFLNNISGFRSPPPNTTLGVLPLAMDKQTWDALLAGVGTDNWTCNAETGVVTAGPDNILEANLFPQGTDAPGNRGTVDVGNSNNSTADIARQILHGVSPSDLEYIGGSLELDANGELFLNGDTGISAGVKDELASIKGKPRIIPLFSQVSGPGNNATYTIVEFAGVNIVEVRLTGSMSSKRVMIQPARVKALGGIPAASGDSQKSSYVYSPVWLIR